MPFYGVGYWQERAEKAESELQILRKEIEELKQPRYVIAAEDNCCRTHILPATTAEEFADSLLWLITDHQTTTKEDESKIRLLTKVIVDLDDSLTYDVDNEAKIHQESGLYYDQACRELLNLLYKYNAISSPFVCKSPMERWMV